MRVVLCDLLTLFDVPRSHTSQLLVVLIFVIDDLAVAVCRMIQNSTPVPQEYHQIAVLVVHGVV